MYCTSIIDILNFCNDALKGINIRQVVGCANDSAGTQPPDPSPQLVHGLGREPDHQAVGQRLPKVPV